MNMQKRNKLRVFISVILMVLGRVAILTIASGCQSASQDKTPDKSTPPPEMGTPSWTVDMYFNQKEFPDKEKFYTGDMKSRAKQSTIGATKFDDVVITYRPLESDSARSIFAVNLASPRQVDDMYCFMIKENKTWKIEAIRGLWIPGFFYKVNESLSNGRDIPDSVQTRLDRFALLTSTDSALKQHLKKNIEQFTELVATASDQHKGAATLLKQLHVSEVHLSEGCVFVVIERIIDNSAGYFYAPKGATLPKMTSHNFIYIEEVLPNWFVYKTT